MPDLDLLSKNTGISFKKTPIIKQAFIHRSYLNESDKFTLSNERLEFLGDSILSFLVSNYLYSQFPDQSEGELTNLRSSIVKTTTLAGVSKTLSLGEYLYLSKGEEGGGGRQNSSILADTFEAFLGAVFLDQNLTAVKKILDKHLFPILADVIKNKTYKDAKSNFQELVQEETRVSPLYKVVKETGPDHAKKFTVGVYVGDKCHGTGTGKSKQLAETAAATDALEKWKEKDYNNPINK